MTVWLVATIAEVSRNLHNGRRGVHKGRAESCRGDGGLKFSNKRNIGCTVTRLEGDGCIGAVRFKEAQAAQVANVKESVRELATDAISFLGG